ncbi:hypothetical protein JM946_17665 [Steroidobacter sp. S1-65]|uniref:PLL-like beta propeller domain-containing protein n=2 Tax=Steroidobacter gossypii TaxID=2805490 RepID=A0ABS1WZZ2_9GAMM|nr:hypothetical protein [Steroidobacter gossypii]
MARWLAGLILVFNVSLGAAQEQVPWEYEWLGEGIVYTPSVIADRDGTITAFIIDKDDYSIKYRRLFTDGTSSGWESLGLIAASDPSAVSPAPGQMTVFFRGTAGGVGYRTWLGGTEWGPLEVLYGNVVAGGPRAIAIGNGRIAVFIVGSGNRIEYRLFDGATWSDWIGLGNSCNIVRPISWGPGHMAVFARCGGSLQYRTWQGGSAWAPWQVIEGNLSEFEVTSWGPNRYDVIANEFSSSPKRLKRLWFDGAWHSEVLPHTARNVGIASPARGVVDFFWQRVGSGFDDVSHMRLDHSQWSSVVSLPRDADGNPLGFASRGVTHVFIRGMQFDYNLLHFKAPPRGNGIVPFTTVLPVINHLLLSD